MVSACVCSQLPGAIPVSVCPRFLSIGVYRPGYLAGSLATVRFTACNSINEGMAKSKIHQRA